MGNFSFLFGEELEEKESDFSSIIREQEEDRQLRLKGTMLDAAATSPQEQAKVVDLSTKSGIPMSAVRGNEKEVEDKLKIDDATEKLKTAPATREKMSDPSFAALGLDDIHNLTGFEWMLNPTTTAEDASFDYDEELTFTDITGSITAGAVDFPGLVLRGAAATNKSLTTMLQRGLEMVVPKSVMDILNTPMPQFIDLWRSAQATGDIIGDFAESARPPEEKRGFITDVAEGFGQLGAQIGLSAKFGPLVSKIGFYFMGAGIGAEEGEARQALDPTVTDMDVATAVLLYGGVTSLTEKAGLDFLMKRLPPRLRGQAYRGFVDLTLAGAGEFVQEETEGAAHNMISKLLLGSEASLLEGFGYEGGVAGTSAAMMRAIVLQTAGMSRMRRARLNSDLLKAMSDSAEASKVRENLPDAYKSFVAAVREKGAVKDISIPAERWIEYFQSADLDPSQVAKEISEDLSTQLEEASTLGTGADIVVPLEDFQTHLAGTEHFEGLWKDMRLHSGDMTLREADTYQEEIEKETSRLIEAADNEEASISSTQRVLEDIREQIVGTGTMSAEDATKSAATTAAFFGSLGDRMGRDPYELWQELLPTSIKGEAEGGVISFEQAASKVFRRAQDETEERDEILVARMMDKVRRGEGLEDFAETVRQIRESGAEAAPEVGRAAERRAAGVKPPVDEEFIERRVGNRRALVRDREIQSRDAALVRGMVEKVRAGISLSDFKEDVEAVRDKREEKSEEAEADNRQVEEFFQTASWTDEAKNKLRESNSKLAMVESTVLERWINDINDVGRFIMDQRQDISYPTNELYSALKSNSDPLYKDSLDFSTLCRKRAEYQATVEAIAVRLWKEQKKTLTVEQLVEIRQTMLSHGREVSCAACYVDSARMKAYQDLAKIAERHPDIGESFFSVTGWDFIAQEHPDVYKELRGRFGSLGGKGFEARTDYKTDILDRFSGKGGQAKVDDYNRRAGLRWQSWSDFEWPHAMDAMQATIDSAAVGLGGHAYTKVIDFVNLMGNTNLMINISLMPPLKGNGLKDGELVFDHTEGADSVEAFKLRKKYDENVGTILIGSSNEQILKALSDPRIDYIIPYHRSGLSKAMRVKMGMDWVDYQDVQGEKVEDSEVNQAFLEATLESELKANHKGKRPEGWEAYVEVVALAEAEARRAKAIYGPLIEEKQTKDKRQPFIDKYIKKNFKGEVTPELIAFEKIHGKASSVARRKAKEIDWDEHDGDTALYFRIAEERGLRPKFMLPNTKANKGKDLRMFVDHPNYVKFLTDTKLFNNKGKRVKRLPLKADFDVDFILQMHKDYEAPQSEPHWPTVGEILGDGGFTLEQSAYHGTPHEFEQFTLDHMKTGEGAHAFGWGLYFAERKSVAKFYREKLGESKMVSIDGKEVRAAGRATVEVMVLAKVQTELQQNYIDNDEVRLSKEYQDELLDHVIDSVGRYESVPIKQEIKKYADSLRTKDIAYVMPKGRLIKVNLTPKDSEWLLWDKPLSEQSEKVREALGLMDYKDIAVTKKGTDVILTGKNGTRVVIGEGVKGNLLRVQSTTAHPGIKGQKTGTIPMRLNRHAKSMDQAIKVAKQWMVEPWFSGSSLYTMMADSIGQKDASLFLKSIGIPGIKYRDFSRGDQEEGTHNFVIFDAELIEIEEFYQKRGEEPPRGKISFLDEARSKAVITLMETADLSTFLHESGHLYLEVLKKVIDGGNAPKEVVDDYNAILKSLGVTSADQIGRKEQEIFADAYVIYLRTGKAPNQQLETAFHSFRAWLVNFLRQVLAQRGVGGLRARVKVSKELQPVFARMLATDQQIAIAEETNRFAPLFTDAEATNMTKAEYARYVRDAERATNEAEDSLMADLMEDLERKRKAWWVEERKKVRAEVEAEVNQRPLYQAIHLLTTGELLSDEDMTDAMKKTLLEMRFSKKILDKQFIKGSKVFKNLYKRLPRGKRVMWTSEGGVHPDEVADFFGIFKSGDALLKAMLEAPPRKFIIDDETDKRMDDQHGDMLKDGTVAEAAREAVYSEERANLLALELRELKRMGGLEGPRRASEREVAQEQVGTPEEFDTVVREAQEAQERAIESGDEQQVADAARQLREAKERQKAAIPQREAQRASTAKTRRAIGVDTKAIRRAAERIIARKKVRELYPNRYAQAAVRASKAAEVAIAKRDYLAARTAKEQQLLNHFMHIEAVKAQKQVDKAIRYFAKFKKEGTRKSIEQENLDQIDKILERYEFKKGVSLEVSAARESLKVWIEKAEADGGQSIIPDYIVNEANRTNYKELTLDQIDDIVDSVKNIETIGRLAKKLISLEKALELQEVVDSVTASIYAHNKPRPDRKSVSPTYMGKQKLRLSTANAQLTKLEFLFRRLDGMEDGGPAWTALFKPIADAENAESLMTAEMTRSLQAIFSVYGLGERARWNTKKIKVDGVPLSMTKSEMIAAALNWGNEANRTALMEGYGWSQGQVESILDHLDERDWQTVQALWDHIDSYWPQIAALERDLTGVAPAKVEATEVHTQFGTFRGGYYPLKADKAHSFLAFKQDEKDNSADLFESNWLRPATKKGHTIERVGFAGKPVSLELSVLGGHLTNVIHDLTHRKAIIDIDRLSTQAEVQEAIIATHGRPMYEQIRPWLQSIARERTEFSSQWEKIVGRARSGASVVAMGWKMSTAFVQPAGYFQSIERLGVKQSAKGLWKFYGNLLRMKSYKGFVMERSTMMQFRQKNFDRDARDTLRRMDALSPLYKVQQSFFYFIGLMDMGVALPTWLGAYDQGKDIFDGNEDKAIAHADSVVRMTQSAGGVKDLAAVQRGSETHKMFFMFYSYFSAMYGMMGDRFIQTKGVKDVPRFIAGMAFLWFLPAVLSELMVGRGPDDDEEFATWAGWQLAGYPFQTVPILRDVVNAITTDYGYGLTPVSDAFRVTADVVKGVGEGNLDRRLLKNAALAAGYWGKLPSRQAMITMGYLYDYMTGEVDDFSIRDVLLARQKK